jgi:hypothetical protein
MKLFVDLPERQTRYEAPARDGGRSRMATEQQVALFLHQARWALASPEADSMPPERRRRWLFVLAALERELRRLRQKDHAA